jgi:TetR/AcrR family transcriptional repressor of nem operon
MSREETAKTRKRIVDAASAEFRKQGIAATGLAEIMAAAGMTHGGFYRLNKRMNSRCRDNCSRGKTQKKVTLSGPKIAFKSIVTSSIARDHPEGLSFGCA